MIDEKRGWVIVNFRGAANGRLSTPGGRKLSLGAGNWDEIKFDKERVLEEISQNRLSQKGCKK
ncbi:MAG: hypothetical protein NTW55_04590 [Planctomycetota bacterium]|nr:hypothetical protein [Planctomycetota bacterium]